MTTVHKVFLPLLAANLVFSTTGLVKAEPILEIDLSVVNSVTITALPGNSLATVSGSDQIGVYMENFYVGPDNADIDTFGTLVFGDLTSASNTPDNTPALYRDDLDEPGLNIYAWTQDLTSSFTAGTPAFTGSATWTLDTPEYLAMVAGGNRSGDLYFPADDQSSALSATVIGQWTVVGAAVPEPSTWALLTVAGLGIGGYQLRRREKQRVTGDE